LENTTLIDFSGTIQYETIGELIHDFKNMIHSLGVQTGTYKKILLVMIESLENIMKYSECPPRMADGNNQFQPAFTIRKEKKRFYISSSNPITKNNISSIENKIGFLNTLNQQGLKDHYKETITNGQFSQRGGAGLGLIEMAKISGNKINYDFFPIDENYVRFNLLITVDESPL
jgi:hypothetical protein